MPWQTFINTLNSCEKIGIRIISFTGGEPLLWDHITRAIHECAKRNLVVGLTSNGALLDEQFLREVGSDLDHVNLSMDSVSATRQSPKSLSLHPELPELLQAASRRTGLATTSNMVLSKANHEQIEPLVGSLNAHNIPVSIGFINPPPDCESKESFPLEFAFSVPQDAVLLKQIAARVEAMKRQGAHIVEPAAYFRDYEGHLRGAKTWDCSASKAHSLQIGPAGSVLSCTRLEMHGSQLLHANRSQIRDLTSGIAERSKSCIAHCYSNCSYNNWYYRQARHMLRFLRDVVVPATN